MGKLLETRLPNATNSEVDGALFAIFHHDRQAMNHHIQKASHHQTDEKNKAIKERGIKLA